MVAQPSDDDIVVIGTIDPAEIMMDPANANLGTERGMQVIEDSLAKYGAGRSILLSSDNVAIAGNKTLEKAVARGLKIAVVETDGNTLLAVRRRDLKSTDPEAKELGVQDNRSGELNLNWDYARLVDLGSNPSIDLAMGFSEVELEDIRAQLDVPSFDDLEDQFGSPTDEDFYNPFKLSLPQEMIERYNRLVEGIEGDDAERFGAVLTWAEEGKRQAWQAATDAAAARNLGDPDGDGAAAPG